MLAATLLLAGCNPGYRTFSDAQAKVRFSYPVSWKVRNVGTDVFEVTLTPPAANAATVVVTLDGAPDPQGFSAEKVLAHKQPGASVSVRTVDGQQVASLPISGSATSTAYEAATVSGGALFDARAEGKDRVAVQKAAPVVDKLLASIRRD